MPQVVGQLPELSVVVPTRDRGVQLERFLARCDQQTLAARRFEVIVVDDGGSQTATVDIAAHRFSLTLLRQDQANPAAARNLALGRCRGAVVLFLTDDALPAFELFERHLDIHGTRTDKVAVLGRFDFSPAALQRPFAQVLDDSDLLFDSARLRDGALHPWPYFWACNLSVPLVALHEVGGFDETRFGEGLCDDLELGLRLEKQGYSVLYRSDLACERAHAMTAAEFFARAVRHGVHSARLGLLHGKDPVYQRAQGPGQPSAPRAAARAIAQALSVAEAYYPQSLEFLKRMGRLEAEPSSTPIPPAVLAELRSLAQRLSFVPFHRGQLLELAGWDPEVVMRDGPASGKLTSIIVTFAGPLARTRECLTRLRLANRPRHPTEFLFVQSGPSAGSAEFLSAQPDVRLIATAGELGLAQARNLALSSSRGEYIALLHSDVLVTEDWLERLLYHAQVDPCSGCIAPVSDRASPGQRVSLTCSADAESLAAFARDVAQTQHRRHFLGPVLDGFCLLFSRRVLDAIGGFDERFWPAGYEDEDFTLRATLAGFRNRCARDVFVKRQVPEGALEFERTSELLLANGLRFAAKWKLDPSAGPLDEAHLEPMLARHWPSDELRVPLSASTERLAPLPQPPRHDEHSPRP